MGVRRYLLERFLYGRRPRHPHGQVQWHPGGLRPRRRFRLWGPMPYYRTRTRRGSEVSVGGCGCCLPVPLLIVLGMGGALRAVWRRVR